MLPVLTRHAARLTPRLVRHSGHSIPTSARRLTSGQPGFGWFAAIGSASLATYGFSQMLVGCVLLRGRAWLTGGRQKMADNRVNK